MDRFRYTNLLGRDFGDILYRLIAIGLFTLSLSYVQPVHAQCTASDLDLQIELQEIVNQAQVLSLSTLGVDRRGQGQQVATLLVRNNSDQNCKNLYFHIVVKNTQAGTIAELDQRQGRPFELSPQQVVRATNNDLEQGLPGIEENLQFDGGLTPDGEDFINDLQGQTSLPDDIYSLKLELYQGNNRLNGGDRVASSVARVGEEPLSSTRDIYINSPGGDLDSGVEFMINISQPQFDWSGETGESFRLVIVEAAQNETPESLLESARSTNPVIVDGQNMGNTLLEFEMADARLSSSNFLYPSSGVKQLESGKQYYWQVTALVQTPEGEQEVNSEIWSFTLAENQQASQEGDNQQMTEQTRRNLQGILGSQTFQMMQEKNMNLQSVIIDGQRYSGQSMVQKLNEIMQRAQNGEITIVNDGEN